MVAGVDALTDVPRVLPATGAAASGATVLPVLAVIDLLAAPGPDGAPTVLRRSTPRWPSGGDAWTSQGGVSSVNGGGRLRAGGHGAHDRLHDTNAGSSG
jgi:hypothetical protein